MILQNCQASILTLFKEKHTISIWETNKEIYLDHASTTFTDEKVLKAMMPFLTENFGNAKSIHEKGFTAKKQ